MENFSLFYSSEEDALLSYADIRNFQVTSRIQFYDLKTNAPSKNHLFLSWFGIW